MIHLLDTDTFILLLRGTAITRAKTPRQEVVKRAGAKILATCKKRESDGHLLGLSASPSRNSNSAFNTETIRRLNKQP